MTVIARDVSRGDILIHRGCDESFCSRWREDKRDGKGYVAKDLSKWTATFEMTVGERVIFSTNCTCTSNGYVICKIPGITFTDSSWSAYPCGEWKMTAYGPDNQRELMAHGYYSMT